MTEINISYTKNVLNLEFLSMSVAQFKVVQTMYVEAKDCLNMLN